jgi:hypothetical protein
MNINATDLGTLVISQPSTDLPAIRISLNVAVGGSLPAGGSVRQILRKLSSAPYDTEWSNDQDAQWGQVTGSITAQADLMALLAAKQSVSGMSNYLTLSQALAGYYPLNNPAGYITASAVDIFLTPSEASAIYQTKADMVPYITDAEAAIKLEPYCYPRYSNPANYATESWVTGRGYAALSGASFSGTVYVPALRNLLNTDLVIDSYNDDAAGTHYLHKFTPFDGKFVLAPNGGGLTFPDGSTQVTSALPLSGGTMSGKLNTTQTATTAGLNIGFLASVPSTTVAGDVWIGDNLNFKDKNGTTKLVANASTQNTFTQPQVIAPPSTATLPALRITNTAAVNSFVVEDEANPDATPFVVGSDGRVGIHGSPATNTAHKLAIYNGNVVFSQGFGLAFGDGTTQVTAATPFDPTGYATESWVTSQNYLTSAVLAGYATLNSPVFTGDARAVTPALSDNDTSIATTAWVKGQSYLVAGNLSLYAPLSALAAYAPLNSPIFTGDARAVTPVLTDNDTSIATTAFVKGQSYITASALTGYATESYVTSRGYITNSALTPYAQLSGATFTGKIFCTAVSGNAGLNIGIGGTEPASTTNGDIWIPSGIGGVINYRDGSGTWRNVLANNLPNIIDVNTATSTALRITQRGAANAFVVEDSTTPDATAFVINSNGRVGIGIAPDATAALKIDSTGMSFNGLVVNPTSVTGHGGGPHTNDLLITINGVQYAIALRAV